MSGDLWSNEFERFIDRNWYRWFAWRPVFTLGENVAWLRFVYRRKCGSSSHGYVDDYWYEYGELFDVLKDKHDQH